MAFSKLHAKVFLLPRKTGIAQNTASVVSTVCLTVLLDIPAFSWPRPYSRCTAYSLPYMSKAFGSRTYDAFFHLPFLALPPCPCISRKWPVPPNVLGEGGGTPTDDAYERIDVLPMHALKKKERMEGTDKKAFVSRQYARARVDTTYARTKPSQDFLKDGLSCQGNSSVYCTSTAHKNPCLRWRPFGCYFSPFWPLSRSLSPQKTVQPKPRCSTGRMRRRATSECSNLFPRIRLTNQLEKELVAGWPIQTFAAANELLNSAPFPPSHQVLFLRQLLLLFRPLRVLLPPGPLLQRWLLPLRFPRQCHLRGQRGGGGGGAQAEGEDLPLPHLWRRAMDWDHRDTRRIESGGNQVRI